MSEGISTLSSICLLENGEIAFSTLSPSWGILDKLGKKRVYSKLKHIDFFPISLKNPHPITSSDANTVQVRTISGETLRFSLSRHLLEVNPSTTLPSQVVPIIDIPNVDLSKVPVLFRDKFRIKGHEIDLSGDIIHSFASSSNRKYFVLGTSRRVIVFDDNGKTISMYPSPSVAGVNFVRDDLIVTTHQDGTVRWFSFKQNRLNLLLTLFMAPNKSDWIVWTPEGFFDSSQGGAHLAGFQINNGSENNALFYSMDRLYKSLYRPDLVQAKLAESSEGLIAAAINKLHLKKILASGAPPSIAFISPAPGISSKRDVDVVVLIQQKGGGFGRIEWKLNGMTIGVMKLGRSIKVKGKVPAEGDGIRLKRTLTLTPGDNTIEVVTYSKMGIASVPATLKLTLKDAISEKPALYILAVGVNKYRDKTLWLNYAVPDAQALTDTLQHSGNSIFTSVHVTKVYDDQATRDGIGAAFAKMATAAKSNDVFILYLAGHGITLDGHYHFLPSNFRYVNEDSVRTSSIDQDDLQRWLADIPAMKNLVLLDTCNSGSFVEAQTVTRGLAEKTAITKLIRATGRAVISASTDTQAALEGFEGHGVFTYALLQAMKHADGKNGNKNGVISTAEIASFINEQVPNLTYKKWGYEQVPQVNLHGREFPVGVVQ